MRWQHPQRGLLPPGEFIPILETSGFIYKLDSYVWEEVCRFLHDRLMKKLRWYRSV
ncbi:MAG: EAL domain-containing protein [[Clostridium] innocuum]